MGFPTSFLKDMSGNFAVTAAIAMVPLMGVVGLGVDYASIHSKRSQLQELADAAALAVAKESSLSSLTDERVEVLLDNHVRANFSAQAGESLTVTSRNDNDANSVSVELSLDWKPFFAHLFDGSALPLKSSATATFSGDTANICVLALNGTDSNTLDLTSKSTLEAQGCGIYSNATSASGISVNRNASLSAVEIYTSGGYQGVLGSFNKKPITDAPAIADPLSSRPEPSVGVCDHKDFSSSALAVTLKPGTYCGGLDLGDSVIATMEPGVYIIKDGPLTVRGNATIKGAHVGFYLTGSSATFDFGLSTQVNLIAPKTGPLSGLLFFEDRSSSVGRTFTIRSIDAERFEGVVYLPKGTLWIDKASRVGQLSNWTAIIANKFAIGNGPNIVVKSDYGASDVPVPEGIAGTSAVRLVK